MWLLIIMGIFACWVISAIGNAAKDEEIANQSQTIAVQSQEIAQINRQIAAKRPDAFIRLFKEEYPIFADALTFSKAEGAINTWNWALGQKGYTQHLTIFDKSKFKTDEAFLQAASFMSLQLAQEVSNEFRDYVLLAPVEETYLTIRRIINSSYTLASQ